MCAFDCILAAFFRPLLPLVHELFWAHEQFEARLDEVAPAVDGTSVRQPMATQVKVPEPPRLVVPPRSCAKGPASDTQVYVACNVSRLALLPSLTPLLPLLLLLLAPDCTPACLACLPASKVLEPLERKLMYYQTSGLFGKSWKKRFATITFQSGRMSLYSKQNDRSTVGTPLACNTLTTTHTTLTFHTVLVALS